MTAQTCAQALAAAQALGLPRLDAQLLLLYTLGRPDSDRAWLLAHDGDVLTDVHAEGFRQLCLRHYCQLHPLLSQSLRSR